jgi:nitronate monooxygenase
MPLLETAFTRAAGIELPIVCGAMYPCSNPELVAAASEAGGIGIVQPLSLVYVHGYGYRDGLRKIRQLTKKPIGLNVIVEKSSQVYEQRMMRYVDEALEEGVRFFVTSLGNPRWVVDKAHAAGGIVYHDVTSRKWADKARESGIDGLIAVNSRAGGHAGDFGARRLLEDLAPLGLPVLCAGGIGDENAFVEAMEMGYAGVQMGTRFIATTECSAHDDYKNAVVKAEEDDIVLTERLTGVPVAVIRTPYVDRLGTKAGPIARWMLKGRKTKHWMRMIYSLQSFWKLKRSVHRGYSSKDFLQAGRSVAGIHRVESVAAILDRFARAALAADAAVEPYGEPVAKAG